MKTGFEFSDLYKFIVSAGIVLITFALISPWFLLQSSFDLLISTEELAKLTPIAQDLIQRRQLTALWLISNITWLSGVIASFGIVFLLLGLFLWYAKHQREEEIKILEENRKRLEARAWTPDRYEKIINKANQELNLSYEKKDSDKTGNFINPFFTIAKYRHIQAELAKKLRRSCGKTHLFKNEWQVGESEFFVLHTKHPKNYHAVIKIKYTDCDKDPEWFRATIASTLLAAQLYQEEQGIQTYAVVIFIVPDEAEIPSANYQTQLRLGAGNLYGNIRFCFYAENKIANLEDDKLVSVVFPKTPEAFSQQISNTLLKKLGQNILFVSLIALSLVIGFPTWLMSYYFGSKGLLGTVITLGISFFLFYGFYIYATSPRGAIQITNKDILTGVRNFPIIINLSSLFPKRTYRFTPYISEDLDISKLRVKIGSLFEGKPSISVEMWDFNGDFLTSEFLVSGEPVDLLDGKEILYMGPC